MNNRFVKREARVLVWGENFSYMVYETNNREQAEEAVAKYGIPQLYMTNFSNWQEMGVAKKCYEWQVSAIPQSIYYGRTLPKPTDAEEEWFWQKQLDNEHFVRDIKEVVKKWDDFLPDEF